MFKKLNKIGPHNLLQLLVMLYIAVGMPVAHPHIHEHSEHDRSVPAHDHQTDAHHHERHCDFKAHYPFFCSQPENLTYLDVMLFRIVAGIEHIEVQVLTDNGQTAKELTAKDYRINFSAFI